MFDYTSPDDSPSTPQDKPLFQAALDYRRRGCSVIPLKPRGKPPILGSWEAYQRRLATEVEVKEWWRRCPDANVGVVTGAISGLFVLDIDGPEGEQIVSRSGLPPTPTVETSPSKRHCYFKHPGGAVPNAVRIVPGLDIRGDGGYVVAPPSIHPSGSVYQWMPFLSPYDVALADPPAWLLKLIQKERPGAQGRDLDWVVGLLQGVPKGQRDKSAIRLACHWLGKRLSSAEVQQLLLAWNERNRPPMGEERGDPPVEQWAQQKINSAMAMASRKKGRQQPPVIEVEI